MEISDAEYRKLVLEVAAARGAAPAVPAPVVKDGWLTKLFIVVVLLLLSLMTADYFHVLPKAWIEAVFGKEQTTFSSTAQPVLQQPPAPLPTQRVYMSPVPPQEGAPVINVAQPTLTLPPTPTVVPSFWTSEEQTQIAATATAFIEVIPTTPPEFIKYTQEQCRDPEKVADSWMLQQMCGVQK